MIQWTNILTIVSLTIIIIASLLGRRISAIATVLGYIGGFALPMLFNSDGVDPGGGRWNNAWIIWILVYIIIILGGFIIDYIMHKRGMNNAN